MNQKETSSFLCRKNVEMRSKTQTLTKEKPVATSENVTRNVSPNFVFPRYDTNTWKCKVKR